MVDLIGRVGVEIADRVVADRGEMNDRVETDEVRSLNVAHVEPQRLDVMPVGPKVARLEDVGVETHDAVSGPLEDWDQHRPDVAVVTRYKDAQSYLLQPSEVWNSPADGTIRFNGSRWPFCAPPEAGLMSWPSSNGARPGGEARGAWRRKAACG